MVTRKSKRGKTKQAKLWTIGHSTRSAEEFHELLSAHGIEALVDVRTFPGSRRYPQFNKETLSNSLEGNGLKYFHLPELGGRRQARKDSKNTAWKNASFRGYADHMESAEFQQGIRRLLDIASAKRTTIMCAEALWWRCHRSLISDFLKATGVEVFHIQDKAKVEPHPFTSAARIVDGELTYAGLFDSLTEPQAKL